jgi:TrmH family RNA methyltransferase
MSLDNISVVLVRTTHPGNIGSVARAMANMGMSDLRLVEPVDFSGHEAVARASGADDILTNAHIYHSLDEAIADSGFVVGATARFRSIAWPCCPPAEAMTEVLERSEYSPVSLVFGREASGLTNAELDRCQLHVRIPVHEDFPSLNLAAAVLIFGYELRCSIIRRGSCENNTISRQLSLATSTEVQGFFEQLEEVLEEIGFLKYPSSSLIRKIKRIFSRTPLEKQEVNILRGILTSMQYHYAYGRDSTRKK